MKEKVVSSSYFFLFFRMMNVKDSLSLTLHLAIRKASQKSSTGLLAVYSQWIHTDAVIPVGKAVGVYVEVFGR